MRNNFITRYFTPAALGAAGPLGAILTGAQAAGGIVQMIASASKIKNLKSRRTAYKTPEEYYDILRATQSMAQNGFDAFTLNYLSGQSGRALSQSIGAATRLGANPNQLSALLDQKLQNDLKIGAENHRLNLENFSRYMSAKDVIGQNKAAEWKSQQDMIKDDLQALTAEKESGLKNLGSAANAAISLTSAGKTTDLYTQILEAVKKMKETGGAAGGVGYAPDFDNYGQPG